MNYNLRHSKTKREPLVKNNYLSAPSILWWKFHKIFHHRSETSKVWFHYASLFVHSFKLPCFLQLVVPFTLILKTLISTTRRTVVRSLCIFRAVGMPVAIIMKKRRELIYGRDVSQNQEYWVMEYYMECYLLMSQLFKYITKISFFDLITFGLSLMRRFNRKTQHSDSPLKKFCSSLSALLLIKCAFSLFPG